MNLFLKVSPRKEDKGLDYLIAISDSRYVLANTGDADYLIQVSDKKKIYIYGDIFYHIKSDKKITFCGKEDVAYLRKTFTESKLEDVISSLEGQYLGLFVDTETKSLKIFSDRYARLDSFYAQDQNDFYLATNMDFIFENVKPQYDQLMIAHLFSVYGWYTPKGFTIYKNVKQLKVGEILTVSASGIHSETIDFKPLDIKEYTDEDLEMYYQLLRDAVVSRAKKDGITWVSSSSGWDSSIILGLLANELGIKNVRMLAGSMKYSAQTAVINKFEIDKIKKIGQFYGIKPDIVDLDLKSSEAADYWRSLLPFYKSRHMYSYVTFNFSRLSDGFTNAMGKGQIVFNGEVSDSFHNFGFSQFATFFHTKKQFTEYADKMNCYLYGPSFLKKVFDGSYGKDKAFQIFTKMIPGDYTPRGTTRSDILKSYLFPFFYGSPRIPFAKTFENPLLKEKMQQKIYNYPFGDYVPQLTESLTPENLYSWYIYLYHSLHSQGSTTNIHQHGMALNGHRWRSPFNDYRLIDFLSQAPESWGRGLELNNTKYPLKWVAKNKIKFPYELLDEGPHSYLYDVIEGFSLFAEITYRSGVTNFFKESVKKKEFKHIMSDEYFDMKYIDLLVNNYLNGKEARGKDFSNLVSLITLSVTGWY